MSGGPLVPPGIRIDHTHHSADRTSGLCESTAPLGGLRPQQQILANISGGIHIDHTNHSAGYASLPRHWAV